MQLPFGININFNGSNNKYVKRKECHEAHDKLEKYLGGQFSDTNRRIDDLQKAIDNYLKLLQK